MRVNRIAPLYVAGRRVNVVRPAALASTLTRRPAPGTCRLGFRARRIFHGRESHCLELAIGFGCAICLIEAGRKRLCLLS